jgi:hypothetical protein
MHTLTLIKWKDGNGNTHNFYLVNKVSSHWRMFGKLFGLEGNRLDGWDTQYGGDAVRCWTKVMEVWLDDDGTSQYPATWKGVIEVVKDAELHEAARELEVALDSVSPPPAPPQPPLPPARPSIAVPPSHCPCHTEASAPQHVPAPVVMTPPPNGEPLRVRITRRVSSFGSRFMCCTPSQAVQNPSTPVRDAEP